MEIPSPDPASEMPEKVDGIPLRPDFSISEPAIPESSMSAPPEVVTAPAETQPDKLEAQ
jgi:hypothetical protein